LGFEVRKIPSVVLIAALTASIAGQAHAESHPASAYQLIRQESSGESIYFVMTDRFDNADTSNDNGGFPAGDPAGGYDPTDPGYWHGGDFKGITRRIPYIKSMGFTSIWITPPVVQKNIQGNSAAYHGYWGIDFTTVDPHLGTEEEFKALVATAHLNGMKVIVDVVANHTADVIYNDFGTPAVRPSEKNIKNPAWLNDINNYHNQGNGNGTKNDFYGLDDIATEKKVVIDGWTKIWVDWINKFDIDGMRIDTFKYVEPEFWKKVIPAVRSAAVKKGKKDFPIFGEVYDKNFYATSSYVSSKQIESVLDFPFQNRVTRFAAYGGNIEELASLFNSDDLYTTATTNASGLITFLGNHDMGRIGYFIRDAVLDSDTKGALERSKLANALLFLLRGSPAVYYGDEKGIAGVGGDKQARQDMFPTKVEDWQSAPRIGGDPIGTGSYFDTPHPLQLQITELQSLISKNPALRLGVQQTRTTDGEVFVVTRYLNNQEYFVAFNGSDEVSAATFKVSTQKSGWSKIFGDCSATVGGSITVSVPARGYCVYKADKKYQPLSKPTVTITAKNIDFYAQDGIAISAVVPGDDYNTVTFSTRLRGGKWKVLGIAEKRTVEDLETTPGYYRVYLQKADVSPGATVEVKAVVSNTAGVTASSRIITVKVAS
jgi:glycosidase